MAYPPGVTDNDFDLPNVDDERRKAVNDKRYLGDGVFVYYDQLSNLIIQTEDGYAVTNRVVLEQGVIAALLDYLKTTPA